MASLALMLMAFPLFINAQKDSVYTIVEKMPEFPGGEASLFQFLNESVSFDSCSVSFEGKLPAELYVVSFIIEKDGRLSNIELVNPNNNYYYCEKIWKDTFLKMPHWVPGEQDGEIVRVRIRMPIRINIAR